MIKREVKNKGGGVNMEKQDGGDEEDSLCLVICLSMFLCFDYFVNCIGFGLTKQNQSYQPLQPTTPLPTPKQGALSTFLCASFSFLKEQ